MAELLLKLRRWKARLMGLTRLLAPEAVWQLVRERRFQSVRERRGCARM